MRNDQIFVLLLVILLPMSGCFDGAVGDAEGTDDASENGDSTGGEGTSTGTSTGASTSSQERTWFSSGGTFATTWSDGSGLSSSAQRCMEWGPSYDPQTGAYLGEECRRYGYADRASDWNVTECTDVGGTPYWSGVPDISDQNSTTSQNNQNSNSSESNQTESSNSTGEYTHYNYRYAPYCMDIPLATINTSSGEALIIYQWAGASLTTTCNGVEATNPALSYLGSSAGLESLVVQGSAMDCTHEITRFMYYDSDPPDYAIWSVVYAIQDVTVV